ncbi:solute carrier family 22 member 21 [Plakobranchus ocellatus]|uniref:Solute carrier family 22 member 21 n=1 Tax=Plakobranchus ocellatus TaxID=259542 RepID=A0AAV3XVK3_9GAST|nr:solute carrier family 22 member 21 [Plakobranchus ocellatus]
MDRLYFTSTKYKLIELILKSRETRLALGSAGNEFHEDLFCEKPKWQCVVATTASDPDTVIGYSVYYPFHSAWKGMSLYMDDLYVDAKHRGKGVGKLLWQKVTQMGLDMGCKGLRLTVKEWNKTARDMYFHHGCVDLTDSCDEHIMHLSKEGMEKFVQDV